MAKSQELKNEYQKGYQAADKRSKADLAELKRLRAEVLLFEKKLEGRQDRLYMQQFELVIKYCRNWSIGDEKIKDGKGYARLARRFTQYAITEIDKL